MSRGFTLIEILVVLTVIGLITGGGILYLTRTNSIQKVDTTKQELLSNLRLARNLAITDQTSAVNMSQVRVKLDANGIMTLWMVDVAGGVGSSYFSKDISPDGVNIALSVGTTFGFSAYEGRFIGTGNTVVITISSKESTSIDSQKLIINQSGLINDL